MEGVNIKEKKVTGSISFGFSKKQETKHLAKSIVSDNHEADNSDSPTKDYVSVVDGSENLSKKQSKEKEFIIPLIKKNKWRDDKLQTIIKRDEQIENSQENESDKLERKAVQEILEESAKHNDEWEDRGVKEESTVAIPLLLQNKIPDGFESDDKLDVALRPDQPDDADYEQIPIEHFGMAMLRGMGWSKSRGVGKNGKNIIPIEAQIRPKGLGLGANRSNLNTSSDVISNDSSEHETLILKKGSYCVITSGVNKDLYGVIDGIDEDNSRVMVKLTLTGKTVSVMQCNVKVVNKKEFEKYSKYLNKGKADEYKEKEKKEKRVHKERSLTPDSEFSKSKHKHSKRHHKHEEKYDSKHRKYDEKPDKRRSKHSSKAQSDSDSTEELSNRIKRPWLQSDLRVRIIDEKLKKGKYFKEKVVIVDVPYPDSCICRTENGKVIESVSQSSVETVIPRADNAPVAIVSGQYHGQLGIVMKRDKNRCIACVQLLSDRDVVLRLSYDDICEYVGNVHDYGDF